MRRTLTLLLLLLSSLCWSQSPITVTGTVVDTSNHLATNGYIQFDLTPANQGLTYQIPPSTVIANSSKCKINLLGQPVDYITGAAPCLLWPNDLILPSNTLYTVTLAPNGRVSRVYNNALFTVSVNPQSLATLRFIQPQPVIGTIINASPLVTQSMVPSNDLAWTIGQPNQRYVSVFTNSIYDYGLANGCVNVTAFHIGSTGAPCGSGAGGSVSGSGTINQIPLWTGGTALGDSILTQVGTDTIVGPPTSNLTLAAGNTTTSGGALILNSGTPTVSGNSGNILVQIAPPPGGGNFGQIILEDQNVASSGVAVAHSGTTGNGYLRILNGGGGDSGAASIFSGHGTPSFNCSTPVNHVPAIYFKTNPSSASDVIWVCISGTTWTALAVP